MTGRVLGDVSLWDDLGERVRSMAWSPDGSLLAVGSLGGDTVVFTALGHPLDQPVHNGVGVLCVAWSADGAHLAVGGQDGVVTLWDVDQRSARSLHHRTWVESLAWSPSPGVLAVGAGADVMMYRPDGSLVADLAFQPGTVGALAWVGGRSEDSTPQLGVGCRGGIRWFDPPATEPVDRFASDGAPLVLALDPTGALVAAGDVSGSLHIWELDHGDDTELRGYRDPVELVAWDGTGGQLAAASGDVVTVWPVSWSGEELVLGPSPVVLCGLHDDHVVDLAFRPGGALLATAGADGRLALWDPATTTEPLGQIDVGMELSCCAWRPGTGTIVVGTAEGAMVAVKLWPDG